MVDLDKITREFILNEGEIAEPSVVSHIQAVENILSSIRTTTTRDKNYLSIAKNHLKDIRRKFRKAEDRIRELEESKEG